MGRLLVIGLLALASTTATAQVHLPGIAPPVNPQRDAQCAEHSEEWRVQTRRVEEARRVCERRDGGTVKTSGVWMPNCRSLAQAYVTCAPISDQLCFLAAQQQASVSSCYRQVAANRNAERDRQSTLRRIEDQRQQLESALQTAVEVRDKGVAQTVIDRYTRTPKEAASDLHGHIREAARTTGTIAPDSQPQLNRVGTASDAALRAMPLNPVAIEFASQSAAAARARMGDALNQLDGTVSQANVEFASTRRTEPPAEAATARSQLRGAVQGLNGGSASQVPPAGGAMAGPSGRLRDPPGVPSSAGHRTLAGRGGLDELAEAEETETLQERESRARADHMLLQSIMKLQRDINANSPANRAASQR